MDHDRILFPTMTPAARRFYSRIINTAVLNMYAVRNGLFPVLLCDSEDPMVRVKWSEALPKIAEHIEARKMRGLGPENTD